MSNVFNDTARAVLKDVARSIFMAFKKLEKYNRRVLYSYVFIMSVAEALIFRCDSGVLS